uniref:Uncharacterized protein n=1 Tax=viral metagenome TaxID=1070528 RepID=A0A6C0AVV1_9ZZZZ|tara:strand:- start:12862 stop:13353 length:492 start_codon:yes stop_codon:yes gene_type:complete
MGKGGGILPVTIHNNKLLFLFGLDLDGWSDFGGSREANETPFQTAIREGCEELNGFLGCKTLKTYIKKHLIIELDNNTYVTYLFYIPYNEYIEQYFNNNSYFMRSKLPDQVDKDGLLEKEKIKWFSLTNIKRNKKTFRKWYHSILNLLNQNKKTIEENIKRYI